MENWDKRFMDLARYVSTWSKDKNTKNGSVIVDLANTVLSIGYNDIPTGVNNDILERYERPQKYIYTEHAERNAIFNAARNGIPLKSTTMYNTMYPCADCAMAIINSEIGTLVAYEPDYGLEKWGEVFKVATEMFEESGVIVRYFVDGNDTFYKNLEYSKELEWDYKAPTTNFFSAQSDWNQTLITKINQANANIIKNNRISDANKIRVSNKLHGVICDLIYYNESELKLSNKYNITIDNHMPTDEIIVYYDGRYGYDKIAKKNVNYVLIKVLNCE